MRCGRPFLYEPLNAGGVVIHWHECETCREKGGLVRIVQKGKKGKGELMVPELTVDSQTMMRRAA